MRIFKSYQIFSVLKDYVVNPKTIIEIGAFQGHDTLKMATTWPEANIYTYEPVPELYEKLVAKTIAFKNIKAFNCAVSYRCGTAQFHYAEKPHKPGIATQAGSLHAPKERLKWSDIQFPKMIDVNTMTLEALTEKEQITSIDLLWLDTQGHELSILKAAGDILKRTRVIVTEVGFIQAYEDQPVYEQVSTWLQAQGFDIVACDFENTTDWFFGNIICVNRDYKIISCL